MALKVQDLSKRTASPTQEIDSRYAGTYARPQAPILPSDPGKVEDDPLMRLSSALAQANPALMQYNDVTSEINKQTQMAAGDKAATMLNLEQNRKSWNQLVDENPDWRSADPWYRVGLRRSYLRQRAIDYSLDMQDAWSKDGDLLNTDDPQKVRDWVSSYRANWIQQNVGQIDDDVEFSQSFIPEMMRSEQRMGVAHAQHRHNLLIQQGKDYITNEITGKIDQLKGTLEGHDPTYAGINAKNVAAQVKLIVDDSIYHHLDPRDANELAAKTVAEMAVRHKDKSLLDSLDQIETAPGQILGKTSYAKAFREKAEELIDSKSMEDENRAWTRTQRLRAEYSHDVMSSLGSRMAQAIQNKDKSFNLLDEFQKLDMSKLPEGFVQNMTGTWKSLDNWNDDSLMDPNLYAELSRRVYNTDDPTRFMQDVNQAVQDKRINAQQMANLYNDLEQARNHIDRWQSEVSQDAEKEIMGRLAPHDIVSGTMGMDGMTVSAIKDKARDAITAYRATMLDKIKERRQAGQEAGPDWFRTTAEEVVGGILNNERHYHPSVLANFPNGKLTPVETKGSLQLSGKYQPTLTPYLVLNSPKENTDVQKQRIWPSAGLMASDTEQFEKYGTGPVRDMASYLDVDPAQLLKQQYALHGLGYYTPEERRAINTAAHPYISGQLKAAAKKHGLDPTMFTRQIAVESGFRPGVVSDKGAVGLGQFTPQGAEEVRQRYNKNFDPTNPEQAIDAAAWYLSDNIKRFGGNPMLGLMAYNMGPTAVDRWIKGEKELPAETRDYIQKIFGTNVLDKPQSVRKQILERLLTFSQDDTNDRINAGASKLGEISPIRQGAEALINATGQAAMGTPVAQFSKDIASGTQRLFKSFQSFAKSRYPHLKERQAMERVIADIKE